MVRRLAAGGSFAWGRSESRPVPPAPAGSLEACALAAERRDPVYLGPDRLARIGRVPGGALEDHVYRPARWSDLYDAMVVFRTERPPQRLDR